MALVVIFFKRVKPAVFHNGLYFMWLNCELKKLTLANTGVPAFAFISVHHIIGQPCLITGHPNYLGILKSEIYFRFPWPVKSPLLHRAASPGCFTGPLHRAAFSNHAPLKSFTGRLLVQ